MLWIDRIGVICGMNYLCSDIDGQILRKITSNFGEVFQMSPGGFMLSAIRPSGPKTRRAPNGSF
jgi:hypothetical protein